MIVKRLLAIIVAVCLGLSFTVMAADTPAGDSAGQEQGESMDVQAQDGESGGDSEGDSAEGESGGEYVRICASWRIRNLFRYQLP